MPGNEVLGCKGMKQFDASGAGALAIYWEQDFSGVPANPDGFSYARKPVTCQTPHSAFKPGGHERCVVKAFVNVVMTN